MNPLNNLAPFLYFSTADNGSILDVNDFLCKHLQYNRDELVGKKVDLIFTLATRIFQQTHFFPLLKMQGYAEEIYISLKRRDGEELPVLINARRSSETGDAVNYYAGIVVHHRKQFEEDLIAARKEAEKALQENTLLLAAKQDLQRHSELLDRQMTLLNKQNEELMQFNRILTHDMQEPLRKLTLFTNLLQAEDRKEAQSNNLKKLSKITNQMKSILSGLQQYI
jgi:sigma-B regulation protein RsbU (phosphoserine phosphatase)